MVDSKRNKKDRGNIENTIEGKWLKQKIDFHLQHLEILQMTALYWTLYSCQSFLFFSSIDSSSVRRTASQRCLLVNMYMPSPHC